MQAIWYAFTKDEISINIVMAIMLTPECLSYITLYILMVVGIIHTNIISALCFVLFCFISSLAWDTQSVDNTINHLFFLEAQGLQQIIKLQSWCWIESPIKYIWIKHTFFFLYNNVTTNTNKIYRLYTNKVYFWGRLFTRHSPAKRFSIYNLELIAKIT